MMRALSLWQPYATGVALRFKTIETRGRYTHVRGEVAIHAAQASFKPSEIHELVVRDLKTATRVQEGVSWGIATILYHLPRGVVLAVAEIHGCSKAELLRDPKPFGEEHWGDYSDGRYGWALKNIRPLREPVACKGKQGFFFLPADVEKQVRAQL